MKTAKTLDARLKLIAGQVTGIQRMLQEGRSYSDVLVQIGAVRAALRKVASALLRAEVEGELASVPGHTTAKEHVQAIVDLLDAFERSSA